MKTSQIERLTRLERPLEEVFAFFSDATNLESLTPPWLSFEILTPRPIAMAPGTLIDYRLRWRGVPIGWRTEITVWDPPRRFVDVQLRGPYRRWIHEHSFSSEGPSTTLMRDRVEFAVWGGKLIARLFVERDVAAVFAYRAARLAELFPAVGGP